MNKIYSLANKLINAQINGKVISSSECNFLKSINEAYNLQDISEKLLKMEHRSDQFKSTTIFKYQRTCHSSNV